MSNQLPQFTDRHRFITSIGLALIVLSVLLPWLVLKEPFEIHTTTQELQNLTDVAITSIKIRQVMAIVLLGLTCITSPFLMIFGISLLGFGLLGWFQKEGLEEDPLKRQRQRESQEEKDRRVKVEKRLQQILVEKLSECIPNSTQIVKRDYSLEDYKYEFALQFIKDSDPDILVRVGYASSWKFIELVSLYFKVASRGLVRYQKNVKSSTKFVGLLVTSDTERISPNNNVAKVMRYIHPQDVSIHYLTESELKGKACDDFLALFFPNKKYPWKQSE